MSHKFLRVYTDGGARGNPGPAAIGVVVKTEADVLIAEFARSIGEATNNQAEYQAVIAAWEYLISLNVQAERVVFFIDSTLVVHQLTGQYKIKQPHLQNLFATVKRLQNSFKAHVEYLHIPRRLNARADYLLNVALDSPK